MLKKLTQVALTAAFLLTFITPASAASYRYWGFFVAKDGQWVMSMVGAAENIPTDGAVDGWRFGIGTDTSTPEPQTAPNFDQLCPNSEASEGIVRVAVVIDFGESTEAPRGESVPTNRVECISMPAGGTSADALAMAADVRGQGGFVCGIDGFPIAECGAEVEEPVATPYTNLAETVEEAANQMDDGGNIFVYAAVILAVVLILVFTLGRSKK